MLHTTKILRCNLVTIGNNYKKIEVYYHRRARKVPTRIGIDILH